MSPEFLKALEDALRRFPTPFYAYDWWAVADRVARLKEAFPFARLFYAIKANPRLGLLRRLRAQGLGAEAVSLGEVVRAYRAGFSPEEVLWNGPVKPRETLRALRGREPVVVLDSRGDLERVAEELPRARVLLRVNPDLPVKTHSHLATGRGESQFGVLPGEVPAMLREAQERGLEVLGLHLHLGSALENPEDFLQGYGVLQALRQGVGLFPVLDLGGGFGLDLDLKALAPAMVSLARAYGAEVWLEPGRYLVAEAGVLVARVMGIKETRRRYILLDAGMTTFLRPALYGARHPVLPLYRGGEEEVYDLAGPACEAGDMLARGVRLPRPEEGDAVAILEAGAYGASMALPYLDTPRPLELLWTGEAWEVLRPQDTWESLFAEEEH
ncbi:diaminopimelate decarboxylase [Thermus sp. 2.9]|uniref:diaminopimelate decarboxylase n=1 Tax=Thermus sp. (strain 2.9) TaxID=1577051 RepID=UPI0005444D34|nr:diaminopimelate decarboxylase [Thermus sp. 2.9]KHG64400.1 diaminopimelate decarboxylase [Thermus sp. 2.9]